MNPTARSIFMAGSLAAACLLGGCLTRPPLVQQTFALEQPAQPVADAVPRHGVLRMNAVQVSPLFEGRMFVYRTGPDQYQADPYAAFLVPPARTLALSMAAHMRNAEVFQDVVEQGSRRAADTLLEVEATELYGDWRDQAKPAAVLALKFQWFTDGTAQPKLLLQKEYAQRVALPERTAVALAAGWNQALAEIMRTAMADVAAVR